MSEMDVDPGPSGAASPYDPHRGILLTKAELRELSRLRPARALRDVALLWLQIVASWLVVALWPAWWTVLLAIAVIGTRKYALHVIAHDAIHRRVLSDAARNDLFADLFLLGPAGAVLHLNGRNHILHHRYLATPDDPDRHKYGSYNKTTLAELLWYLSGGASLVPLLRNVFLRHRAQQGAQVDGYTARDVVILVVWQLLLLTGLTVGIGWWAYPVLWLLPVYVFNYGGDTARQFLEHAHPVPDREADERRLITHQSHFLERLVLAPCNMNFHTAHHLWPSVPYYNLPQADRLARERNASSQLIWRRSYLESLRLYVRALPLPKGGMEDA